ncbi:hypothetical protein L6452_07776 [Arctium lappa]|uniref:Uncharacterized protein n=1 Tax=Arctium lappa TaxID=4217 RepID=A0ACB9EKZ6_ARCLA|nr:hypothetical protein L6452_07776 [Arctium lappa]
MIMNPQFPDHVHLNCPRCDSSNTKFCYYNNYNLSQPRHYCKNCRRYWTKGGNLRNIPVGGGTRKINKRSSNSISNKRPADHSSPPTSPATTSSPSPPLAVADSKVEHLLLRSDQRVQFGRFLDGLRPNLSDGSEEDGLIGAPVTDVCRKKYLSLNGDRNQSGSGGGTEETSGWNGGGNGWPNLSIFTPGSNHN